MSWKAMKRRLMRELKRIKVKRKMKLNGGINTNWDHLKFEDVEELESKDLVEEFEKLIGYVFPEDFKDFVYKYNCPYFITDTFDVDIEDIGSTVFDLHSFNKDSGCSVWKMYEWYNEDEQDFVGKYIQFGSSGFGDYICFDMETNEVVFIDHETLEIVKLADTFTEFTHMLYEDDYED